ADAGGGIPQEATRDDGTAFGRDGRGPGKRRVLELLVRLAIPCVGRGCQEEDRGSQEKGNGGFAEDQGFLRVLPLSQTTSGRCRHFAAEQSARSASARRHQCTRAGRSGRDLQLPAGDRKRRTGYDGPQPRGVAAVSPEGLRESRSTHQYPETTGHFFLQ